MKENKINILYLASHGFAVRMLMQTNLLSKLKDAGYDVGIVTTDASDPSVTEYCNLYGISNVEFKERPWFLQAYYELFRRYILEDVKNNPALYEKHLRLRDLASKHFSAKWKYYTCNIIYAVVKKMPVLRSLFKKTENRFLKDKRANELIRKYSPDLLISTVPVNIAEAKILHSASKSSIKTVTHILSWDNITCKGHFRKLTDEFIVWGEIMKNELMHYYKIDPKKIFETGVPHFDIHFQNKAALSVQANSSTGSAYMLFAMSSPYFAPREIEIVETIARWVDEGVWPDLHFVIRPHPQNVIGNMADLNWLPRLQRLESTKVSVNYPSLNEDSGINWSMKKDDMQSMSLLVGKSVMVLNSCSTMSIDGLCYDKPVIITAFDHEELLPWHISVKRVMDYEHYKNIIQSGGVCMVENYAELKNGISRYLSNPQLDMEKRKEILNREIGKADPNATDRVIKAIQQITHLNPASKKNLPIPSLETH